MFRNNSRRSGFTLVEMLVVIVVIGILMGLLLFAVFPIVTTSKNFAITAEINEISGAIDQFKTKFGFYPPCEFDFDADGTEDLTTAGDPEDVATFKQYLRRIAPNHEQDDMDIERWWTDVGDHLDNDSILVFWLAGLKKNAQFPLTNGNGGAAYDAFAVGEDPANYILFNFDGARLVDGNSTTVKRYLQRSYFEEPYLYYDWQRYADASIIIGGTTLYAYKTLPVAANEYFNPDSFQIVAAGKDEQFGGFAGVNRDWSIPPNWVIQRDNITNFAGGILERVVQ